MTAATITPAATGAELLDELRALLDRHDGAATLDASARSPTTSPAPCAGPGAG
jgi:hypothetical protein